MKGKIVERGRTKAGMNSMKMINRECLAGSEIRFELQEFKRANSVITINFENRGMYVWPEAVSATEAESVEDVVFLNELANSLENQKGLIILDTSLNLQNKKRWVCGAQLYIYQEELEIFEYALPPLINFFEINQYIQRAIFSDFMIEAAKEAGIKTWTVSKTENGKFVVEINGEKFKFFSLENALMVIERNG